MISIDELDRAILELEMRDTTFANCAKLSDLYTVRDHITRQQQMQPQPLDVSGSSEFLIAIDGRDSRAVWAIMDDLMDTIRAVNPRVYEHVLERITGIQCE